jgi:hypothetical protein
MRRSDFWTEFRKGDLFPDRSTVGVEIKAQLFGFAGSEKGVCPSERFATERRAIDERVEIPTPAPIAQTHQMLML